SHEQPETGSAGDDRHAPQTRIDTEPAHSETPEPQPEHRILPWQGRHADGGGVRRAVSAATGRRSRAVSPTPHGGRGAGELVAELVAFGQSASVDAAAMV